MASLAFVVALAIFYIACFSIMGACAYFLYKLNQVAKWYNRAKAVIDKKCKNGTLSRFEHLNEWRKILDLRIANNYKALKAYTQKADSNFASTAGTTSSPAAGPELPKSNYV